MLFVDFFLGTFWTTLISIVWFRTDWFIHYTQLFGIAEQTRLKYTFFIKNNPEKYLPDFLFEQSLNTDNRIIKFVYKLASCPLCTMFWLSLGISLIFANVVLTAPVYVCSLFIFLQIKKMI